MLLIATNTISFPLFTPSLLNKCKVSSNQAAISHRSVFYTNCTCGVVRVLDAVELYPDCT